MSEELEPVVEEGTVTATEPVVEVAPETVEATNETV